MVDKLKSENVGGLTLSDEEILTLAEEWTAKTVYTLLTTIVQTHPLSRSNASKKRILRHGRVYKDNCILISGYKDRVVCILKHRNLVLFDGYIRHDDGNIVTVTNFKSAVTATYGETDHLLVPKHILTIHAEAVCYQILVDEGVKLANDYFNEVRQLAHHKPFNPEYAGRQEWQQEKENRL